MLECGLKGGFLKFWASSWWTLEELQIFCTPALTLFFNTKGCCSIKVTKVTRIQPLKAVKIFVCGYVFKFILLQTNRETHRLKEPKIRMTLWGEMSSGGGNIRLITCVLLWYVCIIVSFLTACVWLFVYCIYRFWVLCLFCMSVLFSLFKKNTFCLALNCFVFLESKFSYFGFFCLLWVYSLWFVLFVLIDLLLLVLQILLCFVCFKKKYLEYLLWK